METPWELFGVLMGSLEAAKELLGGFVGDPRGQKHPTETTKSLTMLQSLPNYDPSALPAFQSLQSHDLYGFTNVLWVTHSRPRGGPHPR